MIVAREIEVVRGGRRVLALDRVCAAPGEVLVVLGPNGAGKSTLLGALAGELPVSRGVVELLGRPIGDYSLAGLARERAVLGQEQRVAFDFCVRDIVSWGRAPHAVVETPACRAMTARAIAAVELTGREEDRISTLSGGEQARVHLGRALCQVGFGETGRYLLLDEPTAALDPAQALRVIALVRDLTSRGLGVVAVVHDLNLAARLADRVVVLRRGEVVASGSVVETLTAELLAEAYDVDVAVDLGPAGAPRITLLEPRR